MNNSGQLQAAERAARVTQWKAEGKSFSDIGQELGVTRQRAYQIWARALSRIPSPGLKQFRENDLVLIDTGISELLKIARDTHASAHSRVEAWVAIRGFMERRSRLLGLDQPVRKEVTHITESMVDAEIERLQISMALQAKQHGVELPALPAVAEVLRVDR